jgi:transposase-like protein
MTQYRAAFPELSSLGVWRECLVFVSDREKGITEGIQNVFPWAAHAYCYQHICDNIRVKYGVKCRKLFWPIARSWTREEAEPY